MTLKRDDGKWCAKRVTLACTIIATASGVVMAMPIATGYISKAMSPWTTLPDQVQSLRNQVDKISTALNVPVLPSVTNPRTNSIAAK